FLAEDLDGLINVAQTGHVSDGSDFEDLPLELEVRPLHQFQGELDALSRRRFEGDDSFGEILKCAHPKFLVFHGLAENDLYFLTDKPLEFLRARKLALHARGTDFERIAPPWNDVFHIQDGTHIL